MNLIWNQPGGQLGMGCFLFFWSFVTLIFDIVLVICGTLGCLTFGYRSTQGSITHSDFVIEHSDDGSSARPVVEFDYTVAGQPYHGNQHSYNAFGGPVNTMQAMAKQYRVGAPVTVYYNPFAPQYAVLHRGLTPMDQLVWLFLTPFNAIMIGGWSAWWRSRKQPAGRPPAGIGVFAEGAQTTIRFYTVSPLVAILIACGATGFLLTFVAAFGMEYTGWLWVPAACWTLVLVAVCLAWRWARGSGPTLVIDRFRGAADYLPADQTDSTTLDFGKLTDVVAGRNETVDSDGDKTITYPLTLNCGDAKSGGDSVFPLTTYSLEVEAHAAREWLRGLLNLSPDIEAKLPPG